jgi:succinate dehydrogenase/fumarate reductase flavoprotein subunit
MDKTQVVEHTCDVLVVGGGLAGCSAAIRAGELSNSVILVDKGNPRRSGCAATGVDHIWAYFPEVQGPEGVTLEDLVNDHVFNLGRGLANKDVVQYIAATALDRILDLEKMGVKVRYEDSTLPGKFRLQYQLHSCRNTLHFDGRDVKRRMTNAVLKRDVKIVDRVMGMDLLVEDGQVAGAVGYGTRDGHLHLFRAKAVILATGRPNRLYQTPVGEVFSTRMPPAMTGDGKAAMFRAGVEVVNMEFSSPGMFASKNFVRGGGMPGGSYQPSGTGVNAYGKQYQIRNHEMYRYGIDKYEGFLARAKVAKALGTNAGKEYREGRGPLYADMSWGSDADMAYTRWGISNEGGGWALNHILEQYGMDYRTDKIELAPAEPEHSGLSSCGPLVDANCMTSLPGLYAAGDEAGGCSWTAVPGALAMGHLAAEQAVQFGAQMENVPHGTGEQAVLEFIDEIAARDQGDPWMDAQQFIQYNMTYYNTKLKSETMAQRGLETMAYLKDRMRLVADNPHEMTHCLEVRDIIENAEMILRATIQRKESRYALFQRVDYPELDDENYFCFLGQRLEGDEVLFRKHKPRH